jgi:hypothetical protein
MVSLRPLNPLSRCHWNRWIRFPGLMKGTVARDFRPSVFSSNNPPRALIHVLKPFRIWLRICRENRLYSNFSGVMDTAETISAVSMTPLKLMWHRWNLKHTFTSTFSSFKGKIQQTCFNGKYPHTIQVLEEEKSWGLPRPHFGDFRSDYLGEYDAICKTVLAC